MSPGSTSSTARTARRRSGDPSLVRSRRAVATLGPCAISDRVTRAMPCLFGKGVLDQSTPPFALDSLGDPLEDDL